MSKRGGVTGLKNVSGKMKKMGVDYKFLARVGAAVFSAGTTGGFARLINARQGSWASLSPRYLAQKRKHNLDSRKWVRTGKTLEALGQGELPRKEGTHKNVRFKITPGRLLAVLRPVQFKGGTGKKGKKAPSDVQKKIWKNLNYGVDVGGGADVRDKRGRRMSGRPGRGLDGWSDVMEKEIEEKVDRELGLILEEKGIGVKR